jgi:hypothetical protein
MLELLESSKSPLSIVSLSGYRATASAIARTPLPILSNTATLSQARAATTSAWVPVSTLGWRMGAKVAE